MAPTKNETPYVGPQPFEKDDQHLFFGRDTEADTVTSLMEAESAVLFYAQSGAGKTSLINTRIVPYFEEEGYNVYPVARVGTKLPMDIDQENIDNIFAFNVIREISSSERELRSLTNVSLNEFVNEISVKNPDQPTLLIIDQFEEILTTYPESSDHRELFFKDVRQLIRDNSFIGVLFAIREDHLAGILRFAPLIPGRLRAQYRMERLRPRQAVEAIEKPAYNADCPFGSGVAKVLVDKMREIQATGKKTTLDEFVEPLQLQIVCKQLWDKIHEKEGPEIQCITSEHIKRHGDVDKSNKDYYELVIGKVAKDELTNEEKIRHWFGNKLITHDIRAQVLKGLNDTEGLPNVVVEQLDRIHHLIRPIEDRGAIWYELVHDLFIQPILASNREWLFKRKNPVKHQANSWENSGKRPEYLITGKPLREMIAWANEHPDFLFDVDNEYLQACRKLEDEKNEQKITRLQKEKELEKAKLLAEEKARAEEEKARKEAEKAKAEEEKARKEAEKGKKRIFVLLLFAVACILVIAWALLEKNNLAIEKNNLAILEEKYRIEAEGNAREAKKNARKAEENARTAICNEKTAVSHSLALLSLNQKRLDELSVLLAIRANKMLLAIQADKICPDIQKIEKGKIRNIIDALLRVLTPVEDRGVLAVHSVACPIGNVRRLAYLDDTLVVATDLNDLFYWDNRNSLSVAKFFFRYENGINSLATSSLKTLKPDEKDQEKIRWLIAIGGNDESVVVWEGTNLADANYNVKKLDKPVVTVALSPDGRYLSAGMEDGTISLWDRNSDNPKSVKPKTSHKGSVILLAFSPDSKFMASGGKDGNVILWQLDHGAKIISREKIIQKSKTEVTALAFSWDSRLLAISSKNDFIRVRNIEGKRPKTDSFKGFKGDTYALAFSHDNKTLASGDGKGSVWLWSPDKPEDKPGEYEAGKSRILSLCYHPQDYYLALAIEGKDDIQVLDYSSENWDLAKMEKPDLSGLKDGAYVVSNPHGKELEKYRLLLKSDLEQESNIDEMMAYRHDDLIKRACRKVWRNFTWEEWKRFFPELPYRIVCDNCSIDSLFKSSRNLARNAAKNTEDKNAPSNDEDFKEAVEILRTIARYKPDSITEPFENMAYEYYITGLLELGFEKAKGEDCEGSKNMFAAAKRINEIHGLGLSEIASLDPEKESSKWKKIRELKELREDFEKIIESYNKNNIEYNNFEKEFENFRKELEQALKSDYAVGIRNIKDIYSKQFLDIANEQIGNAPIPDIKKIERAFRGAELLKSGSAGDVEEKMRNLAKKMHEQAMRFICKDKAKEALESLLVEKAINVDLNEDLNFSNSLCLYGIYWNMSQEVKEYCKELIDKEKNNPGYNFNNAIVQAQLNKWEAARDHLKSYKKLTGDSGEQIHNFFENLKNNNKEKVEEFLNDGKKRIKDQMKCAD